MHKQLMVIIVAASSNSDCTCSVGRGGASCNYGFLALPVSLCICVVKNWSYALRRMTLVRMVAARERGEAVVIRLSHIYMHKSIR